MIGPAAVRPLGEYLADDRNKLYARVAASKSLYAIGNAHPETRDEGVRFLVSVLENYKKNDEGFNGFVIYDLVRLKAVEHIDLIKRVFASDRVDEIIMGDFEDVQVELGLIEKRTKPRPRPSFLDGLPREDEIFSPERKTQNDKKKEKNKNKQEKKSRKKNR